MRIKLLAALLASVIVVPALAQTSPDPGPPASRADSVTTVPKAQGKLWRSSKLIGVNVYNDQNEKLGDISEVLFHKSGKVEGVVIGVGGFLGIGQSDIMVEMNKLKFVDEPVRNSSTTTNTTSASTETPARQRATTTTTTTAPASDTTRSTDRNWYPDHAILSGVTKDQLKGMPQFKYN